MRPTNEFAVARRMLLAACLVTLCWPAVSKCQTTDAAVKVRKLVRLYAQGAGSDDVAGAELTRMGSKARDQLIRMLDDPKTPSDDQASIMMILMVYFPSEESCRALERLAVRTPDPKARDVLRQFQKVIRQRIHR